MDDVVRFGDFEANLKSGELRRDGEAIVIQDLPFRLLAALLERPGEVITRAELTACLWGADTFVDATAGLNTAVAELREALGDDAERPREPLGRFATSPRFATRSMPTSLSSARCNYSTVKFSCVLT
jgi:DNA-binding winged helix-turn-helix (wHTH) protein